MFGEVGPDPLEKWLNRALAVEQQLRLPQRMQQVGNRLDAVDQDVIGKKDVADLDAVPHRVTYPRSRLVRP